MLATETRTAQFLREIFDQVTVDPIYVCYLSNDRGANEQHVVTRDPVKIDAFVKRHNQPGNGIFYCVSTIEPSETTRSKETVSELTGLHGDIDLKDIVESEEEVWKSLEGLKLRPSKIVWSGHGIHLYWLFREALRATNENIAKVEQLLRALCRHLCGDPAPCHVAALMRLPGTHNTKFGEWSEVEEVTHNEDAQYEVKELVEWLKDAPPIFFRKSSEKTSYINGHDGGNPFLDHAAGVAGPAIDVEARLAAMSFGGPGNSSIHITQRDVTASLLSRGHPIDEVVDTVFNATCAAAGAAGNKWNWTEERQDIRRMCETWVAKHPEIKTREQPEADSATGEEASQEGSHQTPNQPPATNNIIKLTFFSELVKPMPKLWGIKGVFARGETSSWVGPPGGGKSALLTDIAVYKAAGRDWRSYRTKGAEGVVYFALERADLVKRRLVAYRMRDGFENLPISVAGQIIDLMKRPCVNDIVDAIKRTEDHFGVGVALAIFDTYAKGVAAGGGNEGDAKDQNAVIANLRRVIDRIGIHIATVGHTGKDETRGERGSNAHKCDVDVEATISGSEVKSVEITKANDQDLGVLTTFNLEPYDLGVDDDGDVFRTHILTSDIPDSAPAPAGRKLSDKQQLAVRALTEALSSHGKLAPTEYALPKGIKVVNKEAWLEEMYRNNTLDRKAGNPHARYAELRNALASRYIIGARDDVVWLPSSAREMGASPYIREENEC